MIPQDVLRAFSQELYKQAAAPPAATAAKMSGKMKAALGLAAAGGVGAGVVGEQLKDDVIQGRLARKQMARSQGIHPLLT